VDNGDHITNVLEFTIVNVLHRVVGNYSRRMLVGNLRQEMGSVPQTEITMQKRKKENKPHSSANKTELTQNIRNSMSGREGKWLVQGVQL
jgi:hypothetical protein